MNVTSPPLPPPDIARWSGVDSEDPLGSYERLGAANRRAILELLPDGWSFDGRRVLDFGCGSGKVLRHFLGEADVCEFYGCDISEPQVRWLADNLSPPLLVALSGEMPPLPYPGAHFDLVWAISVFTHIADGWAEWLLEMHRLLAPEGLLLATFLGSGMSEQIAGEPWDEDRVGMNPVHYGYPQLEGGPNVQLSPWWIRAHWGRAFEVLSLRDGQPDRHGYVLLRRRAEAPSAAELREPEPNEPRELSAARHSASQLARELSEARAEATALREHRDALQGRLDESDRGSPRRLAERVRRTAARARHRHR